VRVRFGTIARRPHALLVRVRASGRLTNVRLTLRRKGRTVARGRLPRLNRRGTVRLPLARPVRAGRVQLRLTAVDAGGRPVRRSGRARLR
jgi:hypothetical protein